MTARILIIEDNPTNLELMVYLLRSFGYEYLVARDGAEGLDVARRERPNLIICDIQLPNIDGYEVARRLKSEADFRSIPLVAVTALAMVGDRDRVLAVGFNGYIAKPVQAETFISQIEKFLPASQRSGVGWTATPSAAAIGPAGDQPAPAGRATILVVDDTAENISLARSILEPSGYKVVTANRLAEALKVARRERPDLILCDVHLPDGNGFDLINSIRDDPELASVRLMLISSTSASPSERARARSDGGVRLILRPIDSAQLLAKIESCLRAPVQDQTTLMGGSHGDDPGGRRPAGES
jgi:two-component system cell cycle response regulator